MINIRLKRTDRELDLVSGWEPLTHPEGALFFYHSYKVCLRAASA
jgi:hypothetical protein